MSLLMDALKKAEREREAQASKEQGGDAPSRTQELSLDPLEEDLLPEEEPAAPARPWDAADEAGELSGGFELEDDPDFRLGPTEAKPGSEKSSDSPAGMEDIPFSLVDEEVPVEDTSATLPSMKAVKASVDRYFDGSQSASMSMSIPLQPDEATTIVKQREAEQARTAAKSMFDAKSMPRRRSGLVWVAIVPLLVLLPVGGAYYYWADITGGSGLDWRTLIGGFTSSTSQVTPSATQPGVAASVPAKQTVAAASTRSGEAAVSGASLAEVIEVDPPAVGDLTPIVEVVEVAPEPEPEVELEPAPPPPSTEELLASADAEIAAVLGEMPLLQAGAIRDTGISISRRAVRAAVNPKVRSAYEAYHNNELSFAELGYRQVLAEEPTNRDALLGLGAIAVRKGRWPAAAAFYAELLRLNPRDSVARAALIALQGNVGLNSESESRIKLMLEREPDADYLHFSLGNLYASQSLWAEAQRAYFNAYRLNSRNADYAYNLAIGLDHLAQAQAALKYYRLALQLAGQRTAGFDPSAVTQRIESIANTAVAQ